jgi:peptide chain release factor 1
MYKKDLQDLADAEIMVNEPDEEIAQFAKESIKELTEKTQVTYEKLKIMLLPKDPNDDKDIVCEIRGAAGGDEANIFAGDLFRMYTRYAETQGWKIQIMDSNPSESGGYAQVIFRVKGEGVYSKLKFESGAHRVQRVPTTEASGRIHTSTATVLVMPEAEELEVELDLNDVRIDTFCASGPGGQCVNTTKSAIRVTHIPTGIVVSCQDGKSQHENKASALKVLQARLYDKILQEREAQEGAERQAKIGHGDRSEKIRTYNYPQNRVTDHRIGYTVQQLDRIMEGKLDGVVEALITYEQQKMLSVADQDE